MRSTSGVNRFSQVPKVNLPRSTFDRSHAYKTTFNAGYLIPVYVDEALPGDTFKMSATMFARLLSPLKQPIMDNMFLDVHYFGVPYRLVYEFWEEMNGQQTNPDDPTDFLIPQVVTPASTGAAVGSLADYMGIPVGVPDLPVSALWFRAYNLIYNEWYRDENLVDSVVVDRDEGPDNYADYVLLKRAKRPDYFTKCLPWPQKGPDVILPLGDTAPIIGTSTAPFLASIGTFVDAGGTTQTINKQVAGPPYNIDSSAPGYGVVTQIYPHIAAQTPVVTAGTFEADLSASAGATLNQVRESVTLQHLFELDARGGTRYTENLKIMFGVSSPDERLQRPEYLGGGTFAVNIHPITNTTQIAAAGFTNTLGSLAATGTIGVKNAGFSKSFTEHMLILGIVSVRADLTYQQGLHRMWSRRTRLDHYLPPLANLGEQAVLNKELYCQGPAAIDASTGEPWDDEAFGYQERWAEYRYKPSMITGQLRSGVANTFDVWHLAQQLAETAGNTPPPLNEDFIAETPPMSRVKAVTTNTPDFILDAYFDLKCARVMPLYSVPGVDRL